MAPSDIVAESENRALIETIEKLDEVQVLAVSGGLKETVQVLAVPSGKKLESVKPFLDAYRTAPERVRGTARHQTLESFIAHVLRFKGQGTALFADINNLASPTLTAVYDYHQNGDVPRFGDHRAVFPFPVSDEWRAWMAKAGKVMAQAEFAEFLEERVGDVGNPADAGDIAKKFADALSIKYADPARLMALSRGLSITVEQTFSESVNLSTGEKQIAFSEEHRNGKGGLVEVPGGFLIRIPVFRGGEPFQMPVRLRCKPKDEKLTWSFLLQRSEKVWETAVTEACQTAKDAVEGPALFYGTPEA
jgi:uncharacterized protein YfdQ (DUF2303 family)